MAYKKPILIEIFSELHLAEGGLAPAGFFELVPALKEAGLSEVELAQVETLAVNPAQREVRQHTAPRVMCWSGDRTKLVQLSPDLVVVNQLGQYLGWGAFEDLFGRVKGILVARLGAVAPTSLSLNTIDSMSPPREDFTVGKYLDCGGMFVPRWYHDVASSADITLGRGLLREDGLNRQLRIAIRVDAATAKVQMNAVFHNALTASDSVDGTLSALHDESTRTFEGVIADGTRTLMGGLA